MQLLVAKMEIPKEEKGIINSPIRRESDEMMKKIFGNESLAALENYTSEKKTQIVRFYMKRDLMNIVADLKVLMLSGSAPKYTDECLRYLDAACDAAKSATTEEAARKAFAEASENIEKLYSSLDSTLSTTSGLNSKMKVLHIDSNVGELTPDTVSQVYARLSLKQDVPACRGSLKSMGYATTKDIEEVFDAFDGYLVEASRAESSIRPVIAKLETIEKKLSSAQSSGGNLLKVVRTYASVLRASLVMLTDHEAKGLAILDKCNSVFRSALGMAKRIVTE